MRDFPRPYGVVQAEQARAGAVPVGVVPADRPAPVALPLRPCFLCLNGDDPRVLCDEHQRRLAMITEAA